MRNYAGCDQQAAVSAHCTRAWKSLNLLVHDKWRECGWYRSEHRR